MQLKANQSECMTDVNLSGVSFDPANSVFRARLIADCQLINETKYFFAPFAEMIPRNAQVQYEVVQVSAEQYNVTLTSDRFVWMLHLSEPDGTSYSDNDFDLWPGESKTITVTTDRAAFEPVLQWMGKEV